MTPTPVRHAEVRTEEDRIPSKPILQVLAVTILIALALTYWANRMLASEEAAIRPDGAFPERNLRHPADVSGVEMTLITDTPPQGAGERQRRVLERYEWVDQAGAIVSIPIERSFDLMLDAAKKREAP